MRLADVLTVLRRLAPEPLAEPWDKVGLQLGDPAWAVRRGLLCVDLTPAVLAEAVKQRVNLIVAYHPPIFEPLTALTTSHWKQRIILEAARRRIAIYSPHTALDAAPGGVNDWLAAGVGIAEPAPIQVNPAGAKRQLKLVTFAPPEHAERLRRVMTEAGAGRIGDYTHCSFNLRGEGTYLGGPSTHPTIGKRGKLERVEEIRMEMVLPEEAVAPVVTALRAHHPYEEPAFDLRVLESPPPVKEAAAGQGRVGALKKAVSAAGLARRVRGLLKVARVEVCGAKPRAAAIVRVAVCAGAGGSVLRYASEADAWVTGEMRHHDVLDAVQRGKVVILAGHTQTERPYLPTYRQRIIADGAEAIDWVVSQSDAMERTLA